MEFQISHIFCIGRTKYQVLAVDYHLEYCICKHIAFGNTVYIDFHIMNTKAVLLPTLEEPPTPQLYPLSGVMAGMLEILNDLYKESHKESLQFYKNFLDNGFTVPTAQMGPNKGLPSIIESVQEAQVGINQIILKTLNTCDHDRVTYDSGWSRYDYCKKCDFKFKEDEK